MTFVELSERNTADLDQMADLLEAKDFENEYSELIEQARYTADHNPLSETAIDLIDQLQAGLRSY